MRLFNVSDKTCTVGEETCLFLRSNIAQKETDSPILTCLLPKKQTILLNTDTHELTSSLRPPDDPTVSLTPTEYTLLQLLLKNQGTLLSQEKIFTNVWEQHPVGDLKTVTVHIKRLREKIGGPLDAAIQSVRSGGYRLRTKDEIPKKH